MRWVLSIFYWVLPLLVGGQNLVKNSSFEEYYECPNALGTFNDQVKFWSTPTTGSTDYFNTCSKVMSAPENFNGVQHPKSGKAYAGFYFYAPADYREYIQAELTKGLKEGEEHDLEFYVSLAEGSDFAVKDFGVVFSEKPLDVNTKKNLSRGHLFKMKGNRFQTFEVSHAEIHEDKSVWLKIKLSFSAKGFERYLTLGNLRDNKSTKKVQTKRKETKKGAYYYIDMVSLTSKTKSKIEQEIEMDSLYVFKDIHFDFDQFNITEEAKSELAAVFNRLSSDENLSLEIHGHTDDLGSKPYNQRLSERRAKAIVDYFVKAGITANRMSWYGHGANKPLVSNNQVSGRAKNRRVEFQIVISSQ